MPDKPEVNISPVPSVGRPSPSMQSRVESMSSCTATDDTIRVVRIENLRIEHIRHNKKGPDLDGILRRLGNPGRYQILLFIFTSLNYLVLASNNLAMIFFGQDPSAYSCSDDSFDVDAYNSSIFPNSNQQCYAIHWNNSFRNESLGNNTHCGSWRFPLTDNRTEPITIATDFNLVCNKKWQIALASSIYFLGVMAGAVIFGGLGDVYGRRVICLTTSAAAVILGVATSFSKSYTVFVILRFFLGACVQGFMAYYSLLMEWFPLERRGFYGTFTESFWSVGVMVLALFAYCFPNWRDIQIAISLTNLVLVVIYFFLIEESLRWLLAQNRTQEATDTAGRVLRFNKIANELSWEEEHELLNIAAYLRQQEQKHRYTVLDCFRTAHLRKVTFCMMYIWAAAALGYYGLSFSISNLIGSPQLNLFIGAALELIPYLASIYIVPRFGRRIPTMVFNFIGGVACIISCLIPGTDYGSRVGRAVLTLGGRMAISGGFCAFLVWTAELYPTVIRANGIGICSVALRVGSAIAPQIVLLGDYTFKELPIIILGLCSLAIVLVAYPMIETMNQILPDTVEAAEMFATQNENKKENFLMKRIKQFRTRSKEIIQ